MSLATEENQRGLKDFLTLYNTITEHCFNKCVSNFNERRISIPEHSCVNICTDNYVQYNQRFMFNFVDHQERRKRESDLKAQELEAKQAAEMEAQQASELLENKPFVGEDSSSETQSKSDSTNTSEETNPGVS